MMPLQNLSYSNLMQIVKYLRNQDKYNILLTCNKWHQAFLPIIVEIKEHDRYIDNRYSSRWLKYNKYIKHMIVYNLHNLNFNTNNYPNLIKITISTIVYVKHFNQLSHLELIGLVFDKHELKNIRKDSIFNTKREAPSNIDMKLFYSRLDNIKHLNITKPCRKFFDLFLPFISNNVRYLELCSDSKSLHLYNTILSKMKDIIQLKLTINEANYSDIRYIENFQFDHLRELNIDGTCLYKISSLKIKFDNMPNLQELRLNQMNNVEFIGISGLNYLELNKTTLKYKAINSKQFLKLNSVLISHSYSYSFQLLYSIFNLPNLTCLFLYSDTTIILDYLLINEIYPNRRKNLVKITLEGFNISYAFIHFLQKSCRKLQQLIISYSYFDAISYPYLLPESKTGIFNNECLNQLEQVRINNVFNYDEDKYNLSKFSEAILLLAPNLKYYVHYVHLPKLKNYEAISSFYTLSHSSHYYGFRHN